MRASELCVWCGVDTRFDELTRRAVAPLYITRSTSFDSSSSPSLTHHHPSSLIIVTRKHPPPCHFDGISLPPKLFIPLGSSTTHSPRPSSLLPSPLLFAPLRPIRTFTVRSPSPRPDGPGIGYRTRHCPLRSRARHWRRTPRSERTPRLCAHLRRRPGWRRHCARPSSTSRRRPSPGPSLQPPALLRLLPPSRPPLARSRQSC